jgi:hypothetical protein
MEFLTGVGGTIAALVAGFVGHVVAHDFCEVAPMLCRKLIEVAASWLPDAIRDRCSQEWQADLRDQPGTLAKMKWAAGCLLCARQMRREAAFDHNRRTSYVFGLEGGEKVELDYAGMCFFIVISKALSFTARFVPKRAQQTEWLVKPILHGYCCLPMVLVRLRYGDPDAAKVGKIMLAKTVDITKCFDGVPVSKPQRVPQP